MLSIGVVAREQWSQQPIRPTAGSYWLRCNRIILTVQNAGSGTPPGRQVRKLKSLRANAPDKWPWFFRCLALTREGCPLAGRLPDFL